MKKVVYDTQCPAEFEQHWSDMLQNYESLKHNKWLNKLYEEKHRWVPCFVKTTFWDGMSTTQRSESMNAFFDGYVHSRTSLKQFVEKFDNALGYKMEKELKADARSFSTIIPTSTSYNVEKQIQRLYTHAKFKEFRNQLIRKMYCEIIGSQDEIKDGVMVQTYDIQEEIYYQKPQEDKEEVDDDDELVASNEDITSLDMEHTAPIEESESKSEPELDPDIDWSMKKIIFKIWFQKNECKVECSCHRFVFRGILCTHAICVLLRNDVLLIPDNYILRRWRKDVKLLHTKVPINSDSWHLTPAEKRYKKLCDYFAELADVASKDSDKCSNIKKWIREQLRETVEKGSGIEAEINNSGQENEAIKVSNPPQANTKGRPCTNRLKPKQYKRKAKKENVNTNEQIPSQQSLVSNIQPSKKRKTSSKKENITTTKEILTQQNTEGAFQSLGGAEINNLNRG
ncbi:protein FAR1-RELATED SEQUENCE 6-like [Papaver somniferum]|uniref:protein FAR1-RELATED SEQUENCE 6-like n=1 Tax=Papaver somniferum TaxID=3469 RepID=UPI000E701688|nr:protein FAR1-RELATED SEQUENCE 6-like [Papaver somniferum]